MIAVSGREIGQQYFDLHIVTLFDSNKFAHRLPALLKDAVLVELPVKYRSNGSFSPATVSRYFIAHGKEPKMKEDACTSFHL